MTESLIRQVVFRIPNVPSCGAAAAVAETGAAERSAASALPAVADAPARYSPWSAAHPRAFAGAVLHFAWHVAHTRPVAAPFVLGLPPQACAALQRSSPHGLDWLADAAPHWLRLRWHDDESHWRRRLVAARDNDLKGLRARFGVFSHAGGTRGQHDHSSTQQRNAQAAQPGMGLK